jgi:hypothetical protein
VSTRSSWRIAGRSGYWDTDSVSRTARLVIAAPFVRRAQA